MTGSESFFAALKSKRESQDIEISEICEFTKINPQYIEAIEKGDFTVLPNVYIRLFLKSYAKFIGADSIKALKDYELHTTGKFTQNEEIANKETDSILYSQTSTKLKLDSNAQISPKQIVSGVGVIFAILLLLWWASQITHEQTKNIKSNDSSKEVAIKSAKSTKKEVPKSEFNLSEPSSKSIINHTMKSEIASLPDKFPLNDNNFLPEKFDTSITITNFKLSPPYKISVHSIEETKLHISEKQGGKAIELINKVVPKNWEETFTFESTIQFEFWNSKHINVNLNGISIDNRLKNDNRIIRGSYEAKVSQLYLSYYKR